MHNELQSEYVLPSAAVKFVGIECSNTSSSHSEQFKLGITADVAFAEWLNNIITVSIAVNKPPFKFGTTRGIKHADFRDSF